MNLRQKMLSIFGNTLLSAILGISTQNLSTEVIDFSGPETLGLSGLGYLYMAAFFAFWGLLSAVILIHVNSYIISNIIAAALSLVASFIWIGSAIEIYKREDDFDAIFFSRDIFHIFCMFIALQFVSILIRAVRNNVPVV